MKAQRFVRLTRREVVIRGLRRPNTNKPDDAVPRTEMVIRAYSFAPESGSIWRVEYAAVRPRIPTMGEFHIGMIQPGDAAIEMVCWDHCSSHWMVSDPVKYIVQSAAAIRAPLAIGDFLQHLAVISTNIGEYAHGHRDSDPTWINPAHLYLFQTRIDAYLARVNREAELRELGL